MNTITVIQPGLMTTLQDEGRIGSQAYGIPVSGCMDQRSLHDANALLNNPLDTAVLEMVYLGGSFRFHCNTYIALTGADMQAQLNDQPAPTYTALAIRPGDTLTLGTAKTGRFGYLAVAGGFDIPPVLGSCATYIKCGIGGFQGRALKSGDLLPLKNETCTLACAKRKHLTPPAFSQNITVRAVPGPQSDRFTKEALQTLFAEAYRVTDRSDRMGYRLEGPTLEVIGGSDIVSDGTAFGSIQVPGSGKPIVLLADRQTTGGYAKIASVISPDLPAFVQCMPGAMIHFVPVSVRKAAALYRKEEKERRRLRLRIGYEA